MIFRKLSEVAPSSASRAKPAPTDTVWHLTLDQIESRSGRIDRRVYGPASEAGSSSFAFDNGNVLYSKLRPYLNKVICPDTSGIATTELIPLRPIPSELNREYLCFYLRSPEFVSWASTQVDGAKMPRMKMKSFWAYQIPVPPLDDQIRIAHLLGKVEDLIARRKQHLQQLDDLLKSVFLEMFGDPVRNEKGWDRQPLEKLGSLNRGISKHRPRNAPELLGGKYPLIQTGEVTNAGTYIISFAHTYSDIGFAQSKLWPSGTLCITIAANIAQTAILTFEACFPDSVVGFTAFEKVAHPLYVHGLFWFFQKILEKNAPAAAQKNINLEILRGLEVPKPAIELQKQFANVVEKIEDFKSSYQQSLTDLEALYGALSQRAFKGKLNLSRVPMPDVQLVEEKGVATTPLHFSFEQGLAINLPDTDLLLSTLLDRKHLKSLLNQWLEAYRCQLRDTDFIVEICMFNVHIATQAIKLPHTDLQSLTLENREHIKPVLDQWLQIYRAQLGDAAFSMGRFINAAQIRLAELHSDDDFKLSNDEQNHIKKRVIKALDNAAFNMENFINKAQTRLAELHPDSEFELRCDEYDHIKKWVFDSLRDGLLTQARNISEFDNLNDPIFGNRIQVRAVRV